MKADTIAETLTSLVKLALHPVAPRIAPAAEALRGEPLVIMANGPSLNDTLATHADTLRSLPTLAVNFAANTPVFADIRPRYYVLADPLFFTRPDDANVARLFQSLGRADWPITLFVPGGVNCRVENPMITVSHFPMLGVEGSARLERWAYGHRLGMPRPRNVLIPSIMVGIWLGFKQIYLTGADHSWMSTIHVADDNRVESRQPHFYKDNAHEVERIRVDYIDRPLHSVVHSFYVAFRAYHQIQRFATRAGVEIINSTPGSFIDAFPRKSLPAK